jgi:hypothetical protein
MTRVISFWICLVLMILMAPSHAIQIWVSTTTATGNMNGAGTSAVARTNADAICAADVGKPARFSKYKAFISFTAADEIRDMPGNYTVPTAEQVTRTNGVTVIAVNFGQRS